MKATELLSLFLPILLRIFSSLFPFALILNILCYPLEVWSAVRMKDLGRWNGAEELRLIGYGLVVGLEGTGDSPKSLFTHQSLANMLLRFGIAVDRDKVKSTNVAAVMVTAEVPPFRRKGDRFDVIVSLLGDAKSLQGGVLLQTTLSDMEGKVWGLASGPLSIGGFNVEAGNVSVRQNYAAVGRVPNGGVLSADLLYPIAQSQGLEFILYEGDFTTVRRLVEAINSTMGYSFASARDKNTIQIQPPFAPDQTDSLIGFIAQLEAITVEPDLPARVVVNERTGTIVIGEQVTISTVAVSHGALSITIKSVPMVSQPPPFSPGETRREQYQEVTVEQQGTGVVVIPTTTTVGDVATALNRLGVTPRDIIAILQSLKEAGALKAQLIIL